MQGPASKRALAVFLAAFAITTAELCWWVTFNLQETRKLTLQQQALIERDVSLARWLEETLPKGADAANGQQDWLGRFFPQLQYGSLPPGIEVRPNLQAAQSRADAAHVRMFVAEGAFFFFMVLLGAALIMRTMRREVGVVRQQANFLNAVTHELKSPLAAMRLYIETLERRRVDPQTLDRYVATLRAECDRLDVLVGHVLTLARLESQAGQKRAPGALSAAPPPELDQVVGQMVAQCMAGRAKNSPPINTELTTHGAQVAMEEASLRTVVRNLLDNACKYGGHAQPIVVRTMVQHKRAQLSVQDAGLGLEPHETAHIFERFYRVGDEMVRKHEGSGLGLYLVRMLLADYGGRITVHSSGLGQGTTFVASLPLVPPPEFS